MDKKRIAEIAFDIQTGLGRTDAPEFDRLRTVGMAGTLAIHIRGLGEIQYEVLRKVSDFYFDIPSYALKDVLGVLDEVRFVDIVSTGSRIERIIPKVPHFKSVYAVLGEHPDLNDLNGHEQATLQILDALQNQPENRDRFLARSGIDKLVFDRCIDIASFGGLVREHRVRGRNVLVSPVYFADNLDGLADMAVAAGSGEIGNVLNVIRSNQGWPLSLALSQGEVGGKKLTQTQSSIMTHLAREGILKPPTISFAKSHESFLFTPQPGKARLDSANREVYERAMALVASVRKGQLLPDQYRIKWPLSILRALRDKGYLGSNSDAHSQYHNLVILKVAYLKEVSAGRWQLHLHKTDENISALNLAIQLLETGDMAGMELNQEARIALSKDEKYIQSIVAAAELRKRGHQEMDRQAAAEFEQLMLQFG